MFVFQMVNRTKKQDRLRLTSSVFAFRISRTGLHQLGLGEERRIAASITAMASGNLAPKCYKW